MAVKIKYDEPEEPEDTPRSVNPRANGSPSPYREEVKEYLRQGMTIEQLVKQFKGRVTQRSIYRYKEEVDKEAKQAKAEPPKSSARPLHGPTDLGAVTARTPAPVIFRIGDFTIDLDPIDLLEAHKYCQDIRRIFPDLPDSFSDMLKEATRHVWAHASEIEARRSGVAILTEEEESDDAASEVE